MSRTPTSPVPPPPPPAVTAFVGLVIVAGSAALGDSVLRLPDTPNPIGWIALGLLAIVAASFPLKIPGVSVYLSISDTFFITSALVFGPAPATIIIATDSLIMSLRRRNRLRQVLFNVTSNAIALWSGAQAYYALAKDAPFAVSSSHPDATMMLPLACLATVYFGLNSGLLAVVLGLSKQSNPLDIWREHFAVISLNYFAAGVGGLLRDRAGPAVGLPGIIAVVVPLILVCYLAMRSWLGRVDDAQRHLARRQPVVPVNNRRFVDRDRGQGRSDE